MHIHQLKTRATPMPTIMVTVRFLQGAKHERLLDYLPSYIINPNIQNNTYNTIISVVSPGNGLTCPATATISYAVITTIQTRLYEVAKWM
jgi:hypothetical protein